MQHHLNHRPNEKGIAAIENIRRGVIELEKIINENVDAGRQKALAFTKLEEVRMWAIQGAVFQNTASVDELPAAPAAA